MHSDVTYLHFQTLVRANFSDFAGQIVCLCAYNWKELRPALGQRVRRLTSSNS